jgi:hypothetical protein
MLPYFFIILATLGDSGRVHEVSFKTQQTCEVAREAVVMSLTATHFGGREYANRLVTPCLSR